MNSGNVIVRLPLASLPPGRGGLSAGVSLMYQSKTSQTISGIINDTTPSGDPITYDIQRLDNFLGAAWQYQYQYSFSFINRRNGYSLETEPKCPSPEAAYDLKFQIAFPDGSTHLFRPVGFNDFMNDGFFNVGPDGYGWTCGGVPSGHPALYTLITTQKMVYYSIDGTYLRLEVEHDADQNSTNNPWTLFFPDGSRVTDGNAPQRIYDRNNNFVEIQDTTFNAHPAKRIVDQFNREVIIEFDSVTNQDFIRQRGVNNEELVWTVKWKEVSFNKNYLLSDDPNFPFPPQNINVSGRMIDQIVLPAQTGTLAYTFRYNAASENPPPETNGWGEMGSIALPSGAKIAYRYQLDGQDNIFAQTVVDNAPTHKDLTYLQEHDGMATPITETWQYFFSGVQGASGSVVAPDGGVSSEAFNSFSTNLRVPDGWDIGVSLKSDNPDGSKVERYWRPNTPFGSRNINPYVKTTFTSIKNAAGQYAKTAIKDYNYDKNGNITRVAEYDWVPYIDVERDGNGRPTGVIPGTAQLKKVTTNTYFNQTLDASITSYDPNAYIETTSPRLRNALATSELGDGSQPLARTELTYDNAATTGNLIEQKSWDSQKGVHSNPLSPSNSISVINQYDLQVSGKLTQTTNPRGFRTEYTYGAVNGFTDLYPTETRVATGTSVQRTETREYDFHTGLVTRVTDADNNVSTATIYDVFGRPTLVKAAEGKPEESRTATEYSDVNRRVIVRADLNTIGDARLVSIQHYDQLGRVRLSRQLEDAAQSATDETTGVKVQTRYKFSGTSAFVLVSNPYRAATSGAATAEATMGWAVTTQDQGGRVVRVETFDGAGLPAPWGTSTTSTGAVLTGYDAEATIVTDQSGKSRKSVTDSLGRLVQVVEAPGVAGYDYQISYAYDALSNLKQVTQGTQTRSFNYSSLSRLVAATNPESGTIGYQYDNNGNLTQKTDARVPAVTTTYIYDALDRVTNRNYSDGTPAVTYAYDAAGVANSKGRLTSVGSSVSNYSYSAYDALGRVLGGTQMIDGQAYTLGYQYDLAGNMKSQTYPSGRVVVTEFDSAGRIAGVKNQASGLFYAGATATDGTNRIQYSAHGAVSQMRLGSGLWEHTNFNSRLRPTQIGLGTSSTNSSVLQLDNGYGTNSNNGNLLDQTITIPGLTLSQSYTYDPLNRLETANENGGDPDGLERCGVKNADGSCAEWVGDFDGERSKEISGGIYKDGAYWNDEKGIWETKDQYEDRTWDPMQEFVNEVARRTEWMEPFGEAAVDMMPVPGPKIGAIKRVSKATGVGWKLLKVARPLKKMGHAAKHLKDFQKIDPSLSADDVAKILEHVRQVGKSSPTSHGGKLYEAAVDIGGKSVNVKVVESAGGVIKTGFPVQ